MGVVGKFGGDVFFVRLEVAFFDVDLGVATDVLLGSDVHWL